jgi:hypothetical protein
MRSIDMRTAAPAVDLWNIAWEGDDARYLGVPPLTIEVDGSTWTLTADGVSSGVTAPLRVTLDQAAYDDLMSEQRTALGLVIAGRVDGEPDANNAFCAWDPVLRSLINGRRVYRAGDVDLRHRDLDQRFRLGENDDAAAQFLADAGFLLLEGVFTDDEVDAIDADLLRAVERARPDDGAAWWAATRDGTRYPTRILNFAEQSPVLRDLFDDPRYRAIGALLDDGHTPGDTFGEHFDDVGAEGLVKRVDSVEGLVCLPWHKDCDRGGHSMFCAGLTIGICLTPVDDAHGGLDVTAGSHRANIARAQIDQGLDLPVVQLRANKGDLTVHTSCTLHRSTHPKSKERRVAYTGFTLPSAAHGQEAAKLQRDRFAIGDPSTRARLGAE